jgi:hypothetical protein
VPATVDEYPHAAQRRMINIGSGDRLTVTLVL